MLLCSCLSYCVLTLPPSFSFLPLPPSYFASLYGITILLPSPLLCTGSSCAPSSRPRSLSSALSSSFSSPSLEGERSMMSCSAQQWWTHVPCSDLSTVGEAKQDQGERLEDDWTIYSYTLQNKSHLLAHANFCFVAIHFKMCQNLQYIN